MNTEIYGQCPHCKNDEEACDFAIEQSKHWKIPVEDIVIETLDFD